MLYQEGQLVPPMGAVKDGPLQVSSWLEGASARGGRRREGRRREKERERERERGGREEEGERKGREKGREGVEVGERKWGRESGGEKVDSRGQTWGVGVQCMQRETCRGRECDCV
eukprot:2808838-Rhodomonas_salina.1